MREKGEMELFFLLREDFSWGQSTYWSLEGEDRREKIARSRAIATKAVQAYTSLLSEFLPIFDFFREFDS